MQEPHVLHLRRRPINLADYKLRGAQESDYSTLITQPTLVYDDEQEMVTIAYLHLDPSRDARALVAALRRIEYQTGARTNGMVSTSRVFGHQPRITIRRDYCTTTALARDDPDAHAVVASYAAKVSRLYQRYNPDLYAAHQREVEKVLPEWTLEDSVFTSGIINKNNPLLYHHDAGNFKRVWSNMLGFKRYCQGGYLAVPEYDLGLEIRDNSLTMFDGQSLLHGVTPITLTRSDGHRFTIVFYSLKQMWQCLPPGEEVKRIQKLRTEREARRAAKGHDSDQVLRGTDVKAARRQGGQAEASAPTTPQAASAAPQDAPRPRRATRPAKTPQPTPAPPQRRTARTQPAHAPSYGIQRPSRPAAGTKRAAVAVRRRA